MNYRKLAMTLKDNGTLAMRQAVFTPAENQVACLDCVHGAVLLFRTKKSNNVYIFLFV